MPASLHVAKHPFSILSKLTSRRRVLLSTVTDRVGMDKKIFSPAGTKEVEKSDAHIVVEIVEYLTNSVMTSTVINKSTGNIKVMSFDTGKGLPARTFPFDSYIQIIEGRAEIVIDNKPYFVETGQGIVIPAHISSHIKPNERFKMILTIIKSGYEL
jgi:quercetin dioxygenase-like cupin family protein